jgi:hypothetical protein
MTIVKPTRHIMDLSHAPARLAADAARPPGLPRVGMLWRRALGQARQVLEAEGMSPESAAMAAEDALVACALGDTPRSQEEACTLLLRAARCHQRA